MGRRDSLAGDDGIDSMEGLKYDIQLKEVGLIETFMIVNLTPHLFFEFDANHIRNHS